MAQPGTAPAQAIYPVNVHYNQNKGWWITPQSSRVPVDKTVQFTTDTDCTICFAPQNTVFGASQNVNVNSPVDVPVGPDDFTVDLCATFQGQTCTPSRPIAAMGTIIIGSGEGGPKHKK